VHVRAGTAFILTRKLRAKAQGIVWSAGAIPRRLLKCLVFDLFFGGARGGGKTDGILGEWVRHADRYGKTPGGLWEQEEIRLPRYTPLIRGASFISFWWVIF
jgi:hypothetical protein